MTAFLHNYHDPLVVTALLYVLVLLAIFADLVSGVHKAKARGEVSSSFGFRRTVEKISKYYNMLFVLSIIDTIFIVCHVHRLFLHIPMLPYLTAIGVIFLCLIELKSIYESQDAKDKARFKDAGILAENIVKNKESAQAIISALGDYLKSNNEQNKDNNGKINP